MGKKSNTTCEIAVCTDGKCAAKNSKKVRSKLKDLVEERSLESTVKVKKASCLGSCGAGPVVKVGPEKTKFTKVSPTNASDIIDAAVSASPAKGKKKKKKKE